MLSPRRREEYSRSSSLRLQAFYCQHRAHPGNWTDDCMTEKEYEALYEALEAAHKILPGAKECDAKDSEPNPPTSPCNAGLRSPFRHMRTARLRSSPRRESRRR